MPPPRAALSTPSANLSSSVRDIPAHPSTRLACSMVRGTRRTPVPAARLSSGLARRGGGPVPGQGGAERLPDLPGDLVVVHVARHGDDQVGRGVPGRVVIGDLPPGDLIDRGHGAENRPAERGVTV